MFTRVRILSTATAMLALAAQAKSQGAPSFSTRIHVAQSADSKDLEAKPAQFLVTFPDSGASSYLVNAALWFDVLNNDRAQFGPFVELSKNSLISKKQDVFQTGVSLVEWQPFGGHTGQSWVQVFTGAANYKRDAAMRADAFQASFGTRIGIAGTDSPWAPGHEAVVGAIKTGYVPFVGVEYENDVPDSPSKSTTNVTRAVGQFSLTIKPSSAAYYDKIALNLTTETRRDLANAAAPLAWHPNTTLALTWYFYKKDKHSFGITGSASSGEDPSKGLQRQKSAQLAFVASW